MNDHSAPLSETASPDTDFSSFGLKPEILHGVEEAGFKVPSSIQEQAIPIILQGRDMIGQAHTGTGKTAAFGLPGLNALKKTGRVEMLVVTPTRELAVQVSEEIYRLGQFLPVRVIAVYGGQPYNRQIETIRRGAHVVVATPGRLLDLLEGGRIKDAFTPSMVVLDEADEMLDMGFLEDIQKILTFLPEERQTMLFSATMPKPIQELARKFLKDPVTIRVGHKEPTSSEIKQHYYVVDEHERDDATTRLIDSLEPTRAMIFCRTRREVDRVASTLSGRGILAFGLHGEMEQPARERVLNGFRNGDFNVLVATDVAARGIDVPEVSHVFNYHIPFDTESYVHRIGRTGRAGRKGVAVTLVTPSEYQGLRRIQSKVGRMEHQLVPSHTELKRANERKLLESIRMQHSDGDAENFLRALEDEFGLAQAANKMAALLLARDEVHGPDKIGVQGKRLERLKEPARPAARDGGRFRGREWPRSGKSAAKSGRGEKAPWTKEKPKFTKSESGRPAFGEKKRTTEKPVREKKSFDAPGESASPWAKWSSKKAGSSKPGAKKKTYAEEGGKSGYKSRTRDNSGGYSKLKKKA